MKNLVLVILSVIFLSSCATQIQLADGRKVSKREHKKMLEKAWNESFGKMSNQEKDLIYSVPVIVDTMTVVPDTIK
jgi:uncharacterized protein YceK